MVAQRGAEAAEAFRRAVDLGGPPGARLALARGALESGAPGRAAEELNRLLAEHPEDAEAKRLLAEANAALEAQRRVMEGQSRFAGDRLERLEGLIIDLTGANRELEARLLGLSQDKQRLEDELARERGRAGELGQEFSRKVDEAVAAIRTGPAAGGEGGPGPAEASRLRSELAEEREARRGEAADARARIALLESDLERAGREAAAALEARRAEVERLAIRRRVSPLGIPHAGEGLLGEGGF